MLTTSRALATALDGAAAVPDWRSLQRTGGWAAGLLALLTVAHAGVFAVTGLPTGVDEWFALFARSPLLGLLAFEGLMVAYVIVSIPVTLALFAVLRQSGPTLMAMYLAVSLVGIVTFVVARPAFEMLSLSQGHAAATTDAQRAAYVAAGESALATFHGTAFWVSYALGSIGGALLAAAMLRGSVFGRSTAYLRIASSVLDWGLLVPGVGLYLSLGSVLCLLVFNVLVARRLLQLSQR
jgi:hypothetical protein